MRNKVIKIVVNQSTDTVLLILEGGEQCVPYCYFLHGETDEEIKKEFMEETTGGHIYGVACDIDLYEDDMTGVNAKTIYTLKDGWLV